MLLLASKYFVSMIMENGKTMEKISVSIKCLVFGKSAVNQTSSVKYTILLSDGSGTIKAEGWGQPGLAFFESVIVGLCYSLSSFAIRDLKERFFKFSWLKNPLYISVGSSSKAIPDADIDIEDFNWDFISLRALSRKGQGETFAIVGAVIDDSGDIVINVNNRNLTKRDITITDQLNVKVIVTMWARAAQFVQALHDSNQDSPVVAFCGVRRNMFPQKHSLVVIDCFDDTFIDFSPVCRQAQEIQDYLIRTKKEQDTVAIPENSEDKSRK
ncbi:replication factor A protein 1-like isoform X2 [Daphnia pulicaria]|uniref:replication factor A protein 1-like isoform X2 n=1 Tax=Daphnia pulicaria TaxID=35523 RepID=UPI001EEAE850|nr:replication factor A protein 1-like isoform X2 [Daphnia pulicaria]XP_046644314.1 replication factor A protein 1-like isoform X2 [Daphnia pulicaria]